MQDVVLNPIQLPQQQPHPRSSQHNRMSRLQKQSLLIWLLSSPFVAALHSPGWLQASQSLLHPRAPTSTEPLLCPGAANEFHSSNGITTDTHPCIPRSSTSHHITKADRYTRISGCSPRIGYSQEPNNKYQYQLDLHGNSTQYPTPVNGPAEIVTRIEIPEGENINIPFIAINQTPSTPTNSQIPKIAPKRIRSPNLSPSKKASSDPCAYWTQQSLNCGTPKICSFNKRALLACQSSNPSSPSPLEKTRFSQNTGAPPLARQRVLASEKAQSQEKENEKARILGREQKIEMMDQSTQRLKFLFLRFFLWLSGFGVVQWILGFGLIVGRADAKEGGREMRVVSTDC